MNARIIRGKGSMKWLGPVLSLAVSCALFASCSTEERDFEAGRNNGNNDDGGAADAATDTGDAGDVAANACEGQADGATCGGMSGFICLNESCHESSCGDGFLDEDTDEVCDDGNADTGDGCEPETCTFSCETDADCDDADPCNGEESCDTDDNRCLQGDAPDTTEQVPCTLPLPPGMDAGSIADSGSPNDSGLGTGPILTDGSVVVAADGSVIDASVGVPDAGEPVDPTVGFCKAGLCVPAGCGNGLLQAGEECDDFNLDNTDGCKADCTFTCEDDDECNDQSVCTGTETCVDHICEPGDALECDDDIECTENDCDAALGCIYPLIDADEDGHAPDTFACGDDCDDEDPTSYTGAGDLCGDEIDNDCNGEADDVVPYWFVDCDGDSYAVSTDLSEQQCEAPAPLPGCVDPGWTTRIPIMGDLTTIDCMDSNASVHPNRSPDPYSTTPVPGKAGPYEYDFNCTNVEEKQEIPVNVDNSWSCSCFVFEPAQASQTSEVPIASQIIILPLCCGTEGYTGGSRPACGSSAEVSYCDFNCNRQLGSWAQPCH